MGYPALELLTPRILVVDDERQIHASLRLRLAKDYSLTCCFNAGEALAKIGRETFDLCLADIHMPHMDGLTFIEAARERDPALGFVVLSAFDDDENLRRSIPLQIYDFIPKPLPDRDGFERRVPEWIERTRRRRRQQTLAEQAGAIEQHLGSARIERDVELIASESARDALQQTATLLTTIHAHLVTAAGALAAPAKADAILAQLQRNIEQARKTADAAIAVAAGFFDSAYGNRDTSPALPHAGLRHAIDIARRISRADELRKEVDFTAVDDSQPLRDLSGIDFLLLVVPLVTVALVVSAPETTLRIETEPLARIEALLKDPRRRDALWLNRKNTPGSRPALAISILGVGAGLEKSLLEEWLRGEAQSKLPVPARGLITGLRKCHGVLAIDHVPEQRWQFLLALPV